MVVTDSHGLYYSYLYTPFQCTRPQSGGFNRLLTPLTLKNGMSGLLSSVIKNGTRTYITNAVFSGSRNANTTKNVNLSNVTNSLVLVEIIFSNIVYAQASYPFGYNFISISSSDTSRITFVKGDIDVRKYPVNATCYFILQSAGTLLFHMPSFSGNSGNGLITKNFNIIEAISFTLTGTTTFNFYRLNI